MRSTRSRSNCSVACSHPEEQRFGLDDADTMRMFQTFSAWIGIVGSDEAVRAWSSLIQSTFHDAPPVVMLRLYADFQLAARRGPRRPPNLSHGQRTDGDQDQRPVRRSDLLYGNVVDVGRSLQPHGLGDSLGARSGNGRRCWGQALSHVQDGPRTESMPLKADPCRNRRPLSIPEQY